MHIMDAWANFLTAQVGASAALVGLLFVGLSVNLSKILASAKLADRAFVVFLLLLTVLVASSFLLTPGQSPSVMGVQVLVAGLVTLIVSTRLDMRIWRNTERQYRRGAVVLIAVNQCIALAYVIAGVILLTNDLTALNWFVVAVILTYIRAVLDAWVLLVEINR